MRARPESRLRFAFHAGAYRSASGGYVVYPLGLSDDGRGSPLWNAERAGRLPFLDSVFPARP